MCEFSRGSLGEGASNDSEVGLVDDGSFHRFGGYFFGNVRD